MASSASGDAVVVDRPPAEGGCRAEIDDRQHAVDAVRRVAARDQISGAEESSLQPELDQCSLRSEAGGAIGEGRGGCLTWRGALPIQRRRLFLLWPGALI